MKIILPVTKKQFNDSLNYCFETSQLEVKSSHANNWIEAIHGQLALVHESVKKESDLLKVIEDIEIQNNLTPGQRNFTFSYLANREYDGWDKYDSYVTQLFDIKNYAELVLIGEHRLSPEDKSPLLIKIINLLNYIIAKNLNGGIELNTLESFSNYLEQNKTGDIDKQEMNQYLISNHSALLDLSIKQQARLFLLCRRFLNN